MCTYVHVCKAKTGLHCLTINNQYFLCLGSNYYYIKLYLNQGEWLPDQNCRSFVLGEDQLKVKGHTFCMHDLSNSTLIKVIDYFTIGYTTFHHFVYKCALLSPYLPPFRILENIKLTRIKKDTIFRNKGENANWHWTLL